MTECGGIGPDFLRDLRAVCPSPQGEAYSEEFLSALRLVYSRTSREAEIDLPALALRLDRWRAETQLLVDLWAKGLPADDPLRCPVSLFRTMDFGRLETAHTRTLAWMLRPQKEKEHGFGDALLRAFLRHCGETGPDGALRVELVESEYPVEAVGGAGRLDVFARGEWSLPGDNTQPWALVVECKIDALEGEGQLDLYDEWVAGEGLEDKGRVSRVFLTADGREPVSGDGQWQAMSFLDLTRTFWKASDRLRAAPGYHFLRYYLAGVLQDVCRLPVLDGGPAADPHAVWAYLRTVADPAPLEGLPHDPTR